MIAQRYLLGRQFMKTLIITAFLAGGMLLIGCNSNPTKEQQSARNTAFELEEMATVIAGATFLAKQCSEPNIEIGSPLQMKVVQAALLRGVDVEKYLDPGSEASQNLERVSTLYYQQITQDPNATLPYSLKKNCLKLKQTLAPYI